MAIPTITGVTPNAGSTRGGNIIRVAGTNFRLPPPPLADGPVLSDQQKTVSVKFEGAESGWAYSASSTLILARVPEWRGPYDIPFPAALDVRVANLDDNGVEIPGENATLLNGYTISRHTLAAQAYLQRVIREVVRLFRRHVLENSHYTTSRDYSLTPAQQETLRAQGPLVHLSGPRLQLNRFYSLNREEDELDSLSTPDGRMRRRVPVTVDVVFTITAWANSQAHIHALVQSLLLFWRDIKFVKVDVDPVDPAQGTKDYEFEPLWEAFPDMSTDPTAEDLLYATSQCVVRGVHIDEEFGTIIERGWIITQNDGLPSLQFQAP